ncbi:M14/M99 family metallopeptidase [Salidesulfovibrio brasiliensis]|uniref:M14/M99 family metallopeptidase n=1 Tax=Salidesulfovibrio brasiliensis TaxID=221711 RepID=UPI0006D08F3F|nr:M14/M99 family metallopeptidase [Salidesulfovibrio brasiliensis]
MTRLSSRRRIRSTIFWLSLTLLTLAALPARAASWEHVFFNGTQYPLKVFFLQGDRPGPTIMVQGGIQGDEPSGFVTAQLLTRAHVTKGNLIVLPRANVPSIHLRRRQVNVDMNRRFDQDYNRFYEDRCARVIRFLLARSDAFIHLHEGSGFYYPKYIDSMRNPQRYGQSIIVDTLNWNGTLELGTRVDKVLAKINRRINSRDYQFKLFNTRTFDRATDYPEMRKSLTCYALTTLNIPAMAVEVSKDIRQLDWKVRQQLEATAMLLSEYGVDVELPEFTRDDVLAYARQNVKVLVNGRPLQNGQTLALAPGTTLDVTTVGAGSDQFSPELALFASDRPGVNLMSARRMALKPFSSLELRSDGLSVASAQVRWSGKLPSTPDDDKPVFVCWLNGHPAFVRAGDTLKAVVGDQLILEGVWGGEKEVVNFKGFVAIPWENTGQDLGWEIILDPDNFIDRYQVDNSRPNIYRYRVVRETPGKPKATFYIDLMPREILALKLKNDTGNSIFVPWNEGGTFHLPKGSYTLERAWSNGHEEKLIATTGTDPLRPGDSFHMEPGGRMDLDVRLATTFGLLGSMTFTADGFASR